MPLFGSSMFGPKGPGGSIPLNSRPPLDTGEEQDPRSMMPPPGGAYTGDPESDQETITPEMGPSNEDQAGMSDIGSKGVGRAYHDKATLGDLLPMGLTALISSLVKNEGAKEALQQAGEGFGKARIDHIMKERQAKNQNEDMLIQDAHKAWTEIHGMDVANMPPAVKQKIMALNQSYNKALQDGKITAKEALEISAYAGMVKRAVGEAKPQMQQEQASRDAENKTRSGIAGMQAEEQFINEQDPASTGRQMGVPDPSDTGASVANRLLEDRRQKSPEYQRQTRLEVERTKNQGRTDAAKIRAEAQVAAAAKRAARGGASSQKRFDQAFNNYQRQVAALDRALDKGDIEQEVYEARLQTLTATFDEHYGADSPTGNRRGGDDPLGLGLSAPKGGDSIEAPPYRPGSGGAPIRR